MARRRPNGGMRTVALALVALAALGAPGCKSRKPAVTTPVERISVKLPPEVAEKESTKIVRRVNRNIDLWQELLLQGKPSQAHGLRQSIAREVDENYAVFESVAREGEYTQLRNLAVKGLGFAAARRAEARAALDALLDDPQITIVQNASLALGILGDPATELAKLIALLAHGDLEVRTNAASSSPCTTLPVGLHGFEITNAASPRSSTSPASCCAVKRNPSASRVRTGIGVSRARCTLSMSSYAV